MRWGGGGAAGFDVGAGDGVQRGGDHQLKVALGEDDVGVLPVEHLALLRDAQFAGEAVHGLGEDGAVSGATAAATVPPRPWKRRRVTPHSRPLVCSARCAFHISHVLAIMPPSLLESE